MGVRRCELCLLSDCVILSKAIYPVFSAESHELPKYTIRLASQGILISIFMSFKPTKAHNIL